MYNLENLSVHICAYIDFFPAYLQIWAYFWLLLIFCVFLHILLEDTTPSKRMQLSVKKGQAKQYQDRERDERERFGESSKPNVRARVMQA